MMVASGQWPDASVGGRWRDASGRLLCSSATERSEPGIRFASVERLGFLADPC